MLNIQNILSEYWKYSLTVDILLLFYISFQLYFIKSINFVLDVFILYKKIFLQNENYYLYTLIHAYNLEEFAE